MAKEVNKSSVREVCLKDENKRHQKYLDLLNSFSDEELENMSYWDLVKHGLIEYVDMGR